MAACEGSCRRAYTLEFKLGVLEWMKHHSASIRATARRFGIHRRMVQRWKESELKLNQAFTANGAHRKKIHQDRQPLFQELEEKMLGWFITHKETLLCDNEIKMQALTIANDIGLDNFKASSSWVTSFRKRHSTIEDATKSCLPKDRILTSCDILSTPSFDTANSFLTRLSSNESVKLHFTKGVQVLLPCNDTFVYYDYQAPEHNYSKTISTAALIHTTRLSERSLCSHHGNEVSERMWTDSDDQAAVHDIGHEETVGEDFTDSSGINVSREKPASFNNFPVGFPPLDIDGVLTIASRTYQPEFTFIPELVVMGQ